MTTNSAAKAKTWVEFLASRPEFTAGAALLAQFNAGKIASICDCGCNGFTFMPNTGEVEPLTMPGRHHGIGFQIEFRTQPQDGTVEFTVFVDSSGDLAGIDVDYCGNSKPMPDQVELLEPPYQVFGVLAVTANSTRGADDTSGEQPGSRQ